MENKSTKSVKIEFLVKSNNIWTNVLFYSFQAIVALTIFTIALPIVVGTSGYTQLTNVAVIISLVVGIVEVVYLVAFIIVLYSTISTYVVLKRRCKSWS